MLLFLSMPLILGSWVAFLVFLAYPVIIRVRILDEEKILMVQLKGYPEYCKRISYRIIPYIW